MSVGRDSVCRSVKLEVDRICIAGWAGKLALDAPCGRSDDPPCDDGNSETRNGDVDWMSSKGIGVLSVLLREGAPAASKKTAVARGIAQQVSVEREWTRGVS